MPYFELCIVKDCDPISVLDGIEFPVGFRSVVEISSNKVRHSYNFEEDDSPTLFGEYDFDCISDLSFELRCVNCSKNIGYVEFDLKRFKVDTDQVPFAGAEIAQDSIADFVVPGRCEPLCVSLSSDSESDVEP